MVVPNVLMELFNIFYIPYKYIKIYFIYMLTMIQHCVNLKQFKFTYSIVIESNYWNSVILVMEKFR